MNEREKKLLKAIKVAKKEIAKLTKYKYLLREKAYENIRKAMK